MGNNRRRIPCPARAFTLFEMMAVVFILGIVAAALVPPLGGNVYAPRLRTAANVLAADIDFCASECIGQPGAPRAITFSTSSNRYSLVVFSTSAAVKHPADSQDFINDFAGGRNAQLSGVTLQSAVSNGANVTTLTFDAYGRPLLTADLVITLAYNGATLRVTVKYTTGDVSIAGG